MTVQIELTAEFHFDAEGGRDETMRLIDRLMVELQHLAETDCGVSDPALSADHATRILTVEIVARAADFDGAVSIADSALRSAAHAAGWNTPGWELRQQSKQADLIHA
jgi:hypothetical protein